MATYSFNPTKADRTRDVMGIVTKQLMDELETMNTNVLKVMQDWTGDARMQYDIAKQQWDQAAQRMPASLNAAEVALRDITNGYLQIEHSGVNAWGGYSVK
ncbi:WXG100 family type VII secretion target [Kribbella sp. NPDC051587]|uniref:WXG100 family type VII secretion target n=1 Tax=Kribbella sp. NPDC051587 TaxID=3364119 RepID=UPI0037AE7570